jgi:hypothetical protein
MNRADGKKRGCQISERNRSLRIAIRGEKVLNALAEIEWRTTRPQPNDRGIDRLNEMRCIVRRGRGKISGSRVKQRWDGDIPSRARGCVRQKRRAI